MELRDVVDMNQELIQEIRNLMGEKKVRPVDGAMILIWIAGNALGKKGVTLVDNGVEFNATGTTMLETLVTGWIVGGRESEPNGI